MSNALLELPAMAKQKGETLSVRLRAETVEAAKIVSAYRRENMTDMLSDILQPILVKMEAEEVAKRAKLGTKPKGPKQ
jgi:hypothetical protein